MQLFCVDVVQISLHRVYIPLNSAWFDWWMEVIHIGCWIAHNHGEMQLYKHSFDKVLQAWKGCGEIVSFWMGAAHFSWTATLEAVRLHAHFHFTKRFPAPMVLQHIKESIFFFLFFLELHLALSMACSACCDPVEVTVLFLFSPNKSPKRIQPISSPCQRCANLCVLTIACLRLVSLTT